MKNLLKLLALAAIPAVLLLASSAAAQSRPTSRAPGRPRVVVLPVIVVHGVLQKPNAFYLLQRTAPTPEERDLRTGLLREVVRTVQRDPF